MTINVVERIKLFNAGRNPELLKLKYKAMGTNVFSFFRGTCHLFYQDFPKDSPLNTTPQTWICGDMHLENFGTYKGDNRLVYFDINDFDEACLAPCTWDLVRCVTSILVGSTVLKVDESAAQQLGKHFLNTYANALGKGQARTVERETARGLVKDLLVSLRERDRQDLLDEYTKRNHGERYLVVDHKHTAKATEAEQHRVKALVTTWQQKTQQEDKFCGILDVQKRIAGTSSLGLERYIILIEGNGSPHKNYLLDFKQAQASSLEPYLAVPQPNWDSSAARIVAIQQRMQGTPPALLGVIIDGTKSYVLREMQPTQDRVSLQSGNGKLGRLEKLIQTMGEVTAWNQLRSSGRQGSTTADDLIGFAHLSEWHSQILEYAISYSHQVEKYYQEFRQEL
jgi:uncharacterized protein (DUF2252 family)